jgi:hypothetical protein
MPAIPAPHGVPGAAVPRSRGRVRRRHPVVHGDRFVIAMRREASATAAQRHGNQPAKGVAGANAGAPTACCAPARGAQRAPRHEEGSMKTRTILLALALLALSTFACARGASSGSHYESSASNCVYVHGYTRKNGTYVRGYTRCTNRAPSLRGSDERSTAAKNAFKRAHPCPSTGRSSGSCPGYVIDHVIPS